MPIELNFKLSRVLVTLGGTISISKEYLDFVHLRKFDLKSVNSQLDSIEQLQRCIDASIAMPAFASVSSTNLLV